MACRGSQIWVSKILDQTGVPVSQLPGFNIYCRTVSSNSEIISQGQNSSSNSHSDHKQKNTSQSSAVQERKVENTIDKFKSGISSGVTGILNTVNSISVPQSFKNLSLPNLPPLSKLTKLPTLPTLPGGKKQEQETQRKLVKPVEVDESIKREQHTFSQHIEETNQSIQSFYDTSLVENKGNVKIPETVQVLANKSENAKKLETPGYLKMLKIPGGITRPKTGTVTAEAPKKPKKSELDSRTTDLVMNIKTALSLESKQKRMKDLCSHLLQYPDCRSIAMKNQVLAPLLKLTASPVKAVRSQAFETLSLVGYVPPPRGRGIKILSVDGGGTKGLIAIEMLRMLQNAIDTPLHKMFDYVIGTSTGALIVILAFMYQIPLDECEVLYKEKSTKMFTTNKITGSAKLAWKYAYHDSSKFEEILRNLMGEKYLIDFASNPSVPKMSAVSTLVNVPKWQNFMFRNYNLPPGVYSDYPGNCKQKVWEAVRASSAAPAFYQEITLGNLTLRDGGLLANNPTAIGIHECKLLWPNEDIQCIVSIGTGRYEPHPELVANKWILKDIVTSMADKATGTESVHMTLKDLLPPSTYFRLNPYVSEDLQLDEIREEKLKQMQQDAKMYAQKNEAKLTKAVDQLKLSRLPHQKAQDYMKYQINRRF